jgi:Lipoprotein LpqB beta-propeller domain
MQTVHRWSLLPALLLACAGTDATPDAGTFYEDASPAGRDDAGIRDGGLIATDADSAIGACDLSKPFGAPTPVQIGAVPLEVRHFRLAKNGTRAYYTTETEQGTVRVGTLTGDAVGDVKVVHIAALALGGFAVSDDETQLALAVYAPSLEFYSRTNTDAAFDGKRVATFAVPATLPINHIYHPHFKRDGSIAFALNQRSNDNVTQIWEAYEGTVAADTITATRIPGLAPAPNFTFAPVPASAEHMFVASWGRNNAPYYPRLFEVTRPSGTGPWSAATLITIPTLVLNESTPGPIDTLVPFEASSDGCTLYFGKGVDYFGKYQVLRTTRPR